jgi:hypothetical protein
MRGFLVTEFEPQYGAAVLAEREFGLDQLVDVGLEVDPDDPNATLSELAKEFDEGDQSLAGEYDYLFANGELYSVKDAENGHKQLVAQSEELQGEALAQYQEAMSALSQGEATHNIEVRWEPADTPEQVAYTVISYTVLENGRVNVSHNLELRERHQTREDGYGDLDDGIAKQPESKKSETNPKFIPQTTATEPKAQLPSNPEPEPAPPEAEAPAQKKWWQVSNNPESDPVPKTWAEKLLQTDKPTISDTPKAQEQPPKPETTEEPVPADEITKTVASIEYVEAPAEAAEATESVTSPEADSPDATVDPVPKPYDSPETPGGQTVDTEPIAEDREIHDVEDFDPEDAEQPEPTEAATRLPSEAQTQTEHTGEIAPVAEEGRGHVAVPPEAAAKPQTHTVEQVIAAPPEAIEAKATTNTTSKEAATDSLAELDPAGEATHLDDSVKQNEKPVSVGQETAIPHVENTAEVTLETPELFPTQEAAEDVVHPKQHTTQGMPGPKSAVISSEHPEREHAKPETDSIDQVTAQMATIAESEVETTQTSENTVSSTDEQLENDQPVKQGSTQAVPIERPAIRTPEVPATHTQEAVSEAIEEAVFETTRTTQYVPTPMAAASEVIPTPDTQITSNEEGIEITTDVADRTDTSRRITRKNTAHTTLYANPIATQPTARKHDLPPLPLPEVQEQPMHASQTPTNKAAAPQAQTGQTSSEISALEEVAVRPIEASASPDTDEIDHDTALIIEADVPTVKVDKEPDTSKEEMPETTVVHVHTRIDTPEADTQDPQTTQKIPTSVTTATHVAMKHIETQPTPITAELQVELPVTLDKLATHSAVTTPAIPSATQVTAHMLPETPVAPEKTDAAPLPSTVHEDALVQKEEPIITSERSDQKEAPLDQMIKFRTEQPAEDESIITQGPVSLATTPISETQSWAEDFGATEAPDAEDWYVPTRPAEPYAHPETATSNIFTDPDDSTITIDIEVDGRRRANRRRTATRSAAA